MSERIARVKNAPQYIQRTPEWYEIRRSLMTASVVSSALGMKPFASFTGDVRREAIVNAVHRKFRGNIATRHGVKYEDSVREKFDAIMHKTTKEYGLIRHIDIHGPETGLDWLAASPDGMTEDGELLEIKCPFKRQIKPGYVPPYYLQQIQCQLEVCDLHVAYYIEWQPDWISETGHECINIVVVERDYGWLDRHYTELHQFYLDLMEERRNYVPPPPASCLVRDELYDDVYTRDRDENPTDGTTPSTNKKPRLLFVEDAADSYGASTTAMFVDDPVDM